MIWYYRICNMFWRIRIAFNVLRRGDEREVSARTLAWEHRNPAPPVSEKDGVMRYNPSRENVWTNPEK